MTEFKVGQLVKAEWPDGTSVVGTVELSWHGGEETLELRWPGHRIVSTLTPLHRRAVLVDATLTVVKEAPIPEPTGAHALIRVKIEGVMRRTSLGRWVHYGSSIGNHGYVWTEIKDQVVEVIFEGESCG